MKKVILPVLILFILPLALFSQVMNQRTADPKSGKDILIGYCDRDGLQLGKFGELYNTYYPIYHPKKEVISELKKHREGLSVVIVLGTWCSDSQEQVPKFLKVLDRIRLPKEQEEFICVDRNKEGGDVDVSKYDISLVPTFIIKRNGKEIGRIIETPIRSLEEDLLGIVQ